MMILLPATPSASATRIFWIFFCLCALIGAVFVYCFLWPSPLFLIGSLTAIPGTGLAGLFVPSISGKAHKAARGCIRIVLVPAARAWITGVVFFLIILPNRTFRRGREGAVFLSGSNGWRPKMTSIPVGGRDGAARALDDPGDDAADGALFQWIKETKSWWMLSLIPFIQLLSLIEPEEEERSISKDTYTLY